jgi:hypothetical protein
MVLAAMATWVWTGCESASGTSGINISPASAVLGGSASNGHAVVFTASASGLALPLEWSVGNSSLGSIISVAGSNATYKANSAKGDNIVYVKDQYGNEGSAVVTQE